MLELSLDYITKYGHDYQCDACGRLFTKLSDVIDHTEQDPAGICPRLNTEDNEFYWGYDD